MIQYEQKYCISKLNLTPAKAYLVHMNYVFICFIIFIMHLFMFKQRMAMIFMWFCPIFYIAELHTRFFSIKSLKVVSHETLTRTRDYLFISYKL